MRNLNVQNLFIFACLLKVLSALAGWLFKSPWLLGFALPLAVMVFYMWLGATRRNKDVSGEKFADSCYYLGFIFTIASISVALMDLPNIGTNIQDIAVRFGAAMLSTVLGLSVRVVMVTFRGDLADAIAISGDSLVEASLRLADQLGAALARLRAFEDAVDQAARLSVERVNLQIESLAKTHIEHLEQFYAALAKGSDQAFAPALAAVTEVGRRLEELTGTIHSAQQGVLEASLRFGEQFGAARERLAAFETVVEQAALRAVEGVHEQVEMLSREHADRLTEYFSTLGNSQQRAYAPVFDAVKAASARLSDTVEHYADDICTTLDKIKGQSALEAVARLAGQQQLLLGGAQGQTRQFQLLGKTLDEVSGVLKYTVQEFDNAKDAGAALIGAVRSVVSDSQATRNEMRGLLLDGAQGQASQIQLLGKALDEVTGVLKHTAQRFDDAKDADAALRDAVRRLVADSAATRNEVRDRLGAMAGELVLALKGLQQSVEQTGAASPARVGGPGRGLAPRRLQGRPAKRQAPAPRAQTPRPGKSRPDARHPPEMDAADLRNGNNRQDWLQAPLRRSPDGAPAPLIEVPVVPPPTAWQAMSGPAKNIAQIQISPAPGASAAQPPGERELHQPPSAG